MNPRIKRNVILLVAGSAALVLVFRLGAFPFLSSDLTSNGQPISGTVISVENVGTPTHKEAMVQLPTGETVRAAVPPSCIVFPGQVAKLYQSRHFFGLEYTVWSAEDKNEQSER